MFWVWLDSLIVFLKKSTVKKKVQSFKFGDYTNIIFKDIELAFNNEKFPILPPSLIFPSSSDHSPSRLEYRKGNWTILFKRH